MTKQKNPIKLMIRRYMLNAYIETFGELSELTGINYQTLTDHMNNPKLLRLLEIRALDEVLHFENDDLVLLIRGEAS